MKKQAKYEYTIGGGVAGALAGAALTKLLEDEDRKATLADYLTGGGIGLGLGALGGRIADEAAKTNLEDIKKQNAIETLEAYDKSRAKDPAYKEKKTVAPVAPTSAVTIPLGVSAGLLFTPHPYKFNGSVRPSKWGWRTLYAAPDKELTTGEKILKSGAKTSAWTGLGLFFWNELASRVKESDYDRVTSAISKLKKELGW